MMCCHVGLAAFPLRLITVIPSPGSRESMIGNGDPRRGRHSATLIVLLAGCSLAESGVASASIT